MIVRSYHDKAIEISKLEEGFTIRSENSSYQATIVTAGDGAKVAINVISEINDERYVDHDVL